VPISIPNPYPQPHHLDKTDILSPVNHKKKRFENALDDTVAKGSTRTSCRAPALRPPGAREYHPIDGPGAEEEVIHCLEVHFRRVKGSTAKEVLDVFYIEVGTRLHG
jgi:recyclin-1